MASLRKTLHDVFGADDFRPGQGEIIRSVMAGRDTLAIISTGAGKSLCYQLPALHLPGITIVASPLISLMKEMGIVRQRRASRFSLERPEIDRAALERMSRHYEERHAHDLKKLEHVQIYAQTALCRWKNLLQYFGEEPAFERCGHCDNCDEPPTVNPHS